MKKRLSSPHDSFFQNMMEKVEVARSFFQAHMDELLVETIDWNSLRLSESVRRDSNSKSHYTDITYHALTKKTRANVFLHAEQERGIDKTILERIWRYNLKLMQQHRNQGYDKLPIIINFIVYNGIQTDYPYSPDICDYYEDPDLARLLLGKNFYLYNLNQAQDDEFILHGPGGMMEVLLKRASQLKFVAWMTENQALMRQLPAESYLDLGIDYILMVSEDEPDKIIEVFSIVYPYLKDVIMTAAKQLEQRGEKLGMQLGMQKGEKLGMQKGEKLGIEKAKFTIAKTMLKEGLAASIIQKITGLSLEEIAQLANK